jgi:hypothetical protein
MNFKQTLLSFFPWGQQPESSPESKPELDILSKTEVAPQPPVMMAFYAPKAKKVPGRRGSAGSR